MAYADSPLSKMSRNTLLRNGTVLSHDDTDNSVIVLSETDILIQDSIIVQIGKNINVSGFTDTEIIDCTDKIVSPGFIDTHHHLWETQLKGRHADGTLFDYFVKGDIQSNNFTPEDVFWAQLSASLECIDVGTTTVLNHCFCTKTEQHANKALSATMSSGIRAVVALAPPNMWVEAWDKDILQPVDDPQPEWLWQYIETTAREQPYGQELVEIGAGFDAYYLTNERITAIFDRMLSAGVRCITSHVAKSAVFGQSSTVEKLDELKLLTKVPNLVLSHCNSLSDSEYKLLEQKQIAVSCTPEAETQTALHWPLFCQRGSNLNISIGTDCHTLTPSSLLYQVRTGLLLARARTNVPIAESQKYPSKLIGTTEECFNAITIQGARALGLEKKTGSIRVGKKADLLIFDTTSTVMAAVSRTHPLVAVVRFADTRDLQNVIVNGIWRKRDGKIVPVKVKDIKNAAEDQELSWDEVRTQLLKSQRDVLDRIAVCNMGKASDYIQSVFGIRKEDFVKQ